MAMAQRNIHIYINPLTGMVVPDPNSLNRRPVAIKVTNYPRYVRPQAGLSKADLVFEYYMEQGISRFIAVFYGEEAEKVGPVRSGRLFDEHIFRMYDSFFSFGYADVHVIEYFEALEKEIVRRLYLRTIKTRPNPAAWICPAACAGTASWKAITPCLPIRLPSGIFLI